MGIPERKEREKELRWNAIVDGAERVFFEKGLKGSTMDDVAGSAELSKGTLYLYFKNKEELYFAVTLRGLRILLDLFRKAFDRGGTGLEKVILLGQAFLAFARGHSDYFNALSYFEVGDVDYSEADSVACQCDAEGHEAIGILVAAIRAGIADGSVRPGLDPEKTAMILWGMTAGVIQLVTLKGRHLEDRHGFPMASLVDESFGLIRRILENK